MANTLLGGLLLVAVVLILCIMCASERTLQQQEKVKSEAELRMDEAFPTIFTRMRRQTSRLLFWRKWKPKRAHLAAAETRDSTDQVIKDNVAAEGRGNNSATATDNEQHPHSQ